MARKKRSQLPNITEHDIATFPERMRRTAHGWAWKCAYCGQFACSETQSGRFVCRSHGGVTARQRSPEARQAALEKGKTLLYPPGRPLQSGLYSRKPGVRLDDLVAQYRAAQVNLDCTDEDMLYLRAYQQERMERRPQWKALTEALEGAQVALHSSAGGSSVEAAKTLSACLRETRLLLQQVRRATLEIEKGHARLIQLSKVRADTRVKNHAAQQVEVFTLMVERLAVVLREQLTPTDFAALQARMARELAELPVGLADGSQRIKRP